MNPLYVGIDVSSKNNVIYLMLPNGDKHMLKIREYPDKGALYCEIISKAYLNRFKYRESEMLEVLNMERSTYYDRKKEAILLFGLSLWGTAIPKLKDFLESAREEEALCYCEC